MDEAGPNPTPTQPNSVGVESEPQMEVRFPSLQFPLLPMVEIKVPESWRPIGAIALNQMNPRPDIAVAGPEVSDGIRPNVIVKTNQVPLSEDSGKPGRAETFLTDLFEKQAQIEGLIGLQYRVHPDAPQPYGASRYIERVSDIEIMRMVCAVFTSTGPAEHLVVIQAGLSPASEADLKAIEAIFSSLRVIPLGQEETSDV